MLTIKEFKKTDTGYKLSVPSFTIDYPSFVFNLTELENGIIKITQEKSHNLIDNSTTDIMCMSLESALACVSQTIKYHANPHAINKFL